MENLEKYLKDLEDGKYDDSIKEHYDSYVNKRDRNINKIKSKEYIEWLYNYTNEIERWCDDDLLYRDDVSPELKENVELLSYFFNYVYEETNNQKVLIDDIEDEETLFFKIKDTYYKIELICGQGSINIIEKLNSVPKYYAVIPNDENISDTYILPVFVNKDLLDKTQAIIPVASIVSDISAKLVDDLRYRYWKDEGIKNIKLYFLSTKDINKIIDCTYFIKNTNDDKILVESLGIISEKDFIKYKYLEIYS